MHCFFDCHPAPAWCSKIVKVVFSEKTVFLFTKADLRPWEIERGVSKREKWKDFEIEAGFADAESNTATILRESA